MKTIILGFLLSLQFANADVPNMFNSHRYSTDAMIAYVENCVDAALKANPQLNKRIVERFCGCMADSYQEGLSSKDERVLNTCTTFAKGK